MPTHRRRIHTVVAAGAIASALVALTACSNNAAPADENAPVTLTMNVWGNDLDKKVYTERLDMVHEKYPNINVDLQVIEGGDYDQKLQTAIAGGTGPDIFELAETAPVFASKKLLVPLDNYITDSKVDIQQRYGEKLGDVFKWQDATYAMPDRSGAMSIYYNKDLFDQAGVAYPSDDWTWDDLVDAAQKLTIRDGDNVTQWGYATVSWYPFWMQFIYQNGGHILDQNGQPDVDTPENAEALQFFNDLAYKYKVTPTPRDWANLNNVSPDALFAQGKLAINTTGFWNIASASQAEGLNWDTATLWHGKDAAAPALLNGLAISSGSKHQDAAWKVINFLTDVDGQLPIIDNAQDAPANAQVKASDAFLTPDWLKAPINMNAFNDSGSNVLVPPMSPHWSEMMKVFDDNLTGFFNNEKSATDTLAEIQAQLEPVFAEGN